MNSVPLIMTTQRMQVRVLHYNRMQILLLNRPHLQILLMLLNRPHRLWVRTFLGGLLRTNNTILVN